MNESFKEMVISLIYPALIIIILIFAFMLYIISKNFQTKLNHTWKATKIFECKELHIFLAKASAYRRVFTYFTFVSYLIKALSVVTTFFIVYSLINDTLYSKIMLILSALFDAVSLMFPFQKYIDLFSNCCVLMEESILKNDAKITGKLSDDETLKREIYSDLQKTYIECEKLLHIHNNI